MPGVQKTQWKSLRSCKIYSGYFLLNILRSNRVSLIIANSVRKFTRPYPMLDIALKSTASRKGPA
jgi:hypothetical protein